MATDLSCCGCHLTDDYGTSTVSGSGSVSDPFMLSQVDPDFQRPLLRISRTTTSQSLGTNTLDTITFDSEWFNSPATMWSAISPTDVVIPVTGIYLFGVMGLFLAGTAGARELAIEHDGINVASSEDNATATGPEYSIIYQINTNAGSIVRAKARQEPAGGTINVYLWACYLGKVV